MSAEVYNYSNEEELEKLWTKNFQEKMAEARKSSDHTTEYDMQQKVYENFAPSYDDAVRLEKYSGPEHVTKKLELLFGTNKNIEILDYGSGTGLVADELHKKGFTNISGVEPNVGLMEKAKEKKIMKNFIIGKDEEGLKSFPANSFDVVTSAGVFFVSKTHPGTECFEEIFRILKPGGLLVIFTKNAYLSLPYVNWDIVNQLEKDGIIRLKSKDVFPGYRQPYAHEEDQQSLAAILIYEKL